MPSISKKFLLTSSLALGLSSTAFAAYYPPLEPAPIPTYGWYIGGTGGVAFVRDTTLDGITTEYQTANWDVGAELGMAYWSWRFELEYMYQPANIEEIDGVTTSGRLRVQTGLFNVLYDFLAEGDTYRPYIGAGVGYAFVNPSNLPSNSVVGYQAQAGVRFAVYDNTSFTLGYRYFGTSKADDALGGRFQNNMINAGFIYFFD